MNHLETFAARAGLPTSPALNNSQAREMQSVCRYVAAGMPDTAARALSALIRSARSTKSRAALMDQARALQLSHLPEFIV